jgi:diaminopimelate decarboxylase
MGLGTLERAARVHAKRALRGVVRSYPRGEVWTLGTWGLVRDAEGGLVRGEVALGDLLERHGSPLYVLDELRLADNVTSFRAIPPGAKVGCEPYYSYKTNPVPGVLKLIHAQGVGAEVASPYELWLALALDVAPEKIVYNGPAKSEESLAIAIDRGVGLVNMNGREEIAMISALARARGKRVRVGLRVVTPGGLAGQFGERIDTGAALEAFREARTHPELEVVALHAHVNGEIATREQLDAFVAPLLVFSDSLRNELGLDLEVLDVGGNLACRTVSRLSSRERRLAVTFGREPSPRPIASVLSIDAYVARVVELVTSHYATRKVPCPRMFVEPGRALTGDAQMLMCRVLSVRGRDEAGLTWAVLDAGLNVAEPVPNEFHQLFVVRPRGGASRLYRLTGPSCTLADQLYPAWRLPELAPGDALAIMDAGAYFVPFSTCFSRPRPAVVSVNDGHVEVLRRAETYEDLVLRDEWS